MSEVGSPEFPSRRMKVVLGVVALLVATGVVLGDAGLIGSQPERTPLARTNFSGQDESWKRVEDKGRSVTSIIAERTDQKAYFTATKLDFSIETQERGARFLLVSGAFEKGSAERFIDFLESQGNDLPLWVAFDALGGYYEEAQAIAETIRQAGLNTMIAEERVCGAVCMAAFIGGTRRRITELPYIGGGRFDIEHSETLSGSEGVDEGQGGVVELMAHFRGMGVDPTLVERMIASEPGSEYRFSAAELRRARFATTISR